MKGTRPSQQTPQEFPNPQLFRDAQVFWDLILKDLALQMTQAAFHAWLQPTRVIGIADGILSIQVPNERIKDWLENRLCGKIQETVDYYASDPLEIRFVANLAHEELDRVRYSTRFPDQNAHQQRPRPRTTRAKRGTALRTKPGRPKARTHTTQ